MPWTSYGIAVNDFLGQRPAVVGAGAADGEYLLARADEDNGFFTDMTREDFTLPNLLDRDAFRQVRTCNSIRFRAHSRFLRAQNGAPTCQLDSARSERFLRSIKAIVALWPAKEKISVSSPTGAPRAVEPMTKSRD